MANIIGIDSSLVPRSIVSIPKRKPIAPSIERRCKTCNGVIGEKKRGRPVCVFDEESHPVCVECAKFFGDFGFFGGGVTNLDPPAAHDRIRDLREKGWGILIKSGQFADSSGIQISVQIGDIFKIVRAGLMDPDVEAQCSKSRTLQLFSIDISVGPVPLRLWPHEISAISWITIMELRKAGEIEEAFVAAEDEHGYFKPTIEIPWR
jgi:hypothetical protein